MNKKTDNYSRQQAREFARDVRKRWGAGWALLSEHQREAEIAREFYHIVLGWESEKHEAARLAKAFAEEIDRERN